MVGKFGDDVAQQLAIGRQRVGRFQISCDVRCLQRVLESFVWAIGVAVAGLTTVWLVVRAGQVFKLPESRLSFVLMRPPSRTWS